jgi:uncharacterized short protein YbdD (DUF466 family)
MRDRGEGGRGKGEGAASLPQRLVRIVRSIIGAPDYHAYLEHCRQAGHPPQLCEREYVDQYFTSKGKVVRCC